MSEYRFTAKNIKKAFPEWNDFDCVYMAIGLNEAMKAGLISPPVYVGRNNLTKKIRCFATCIEGKPEDTETNTFEHWTGQS